jgi:hypothetical protein
VIVIAIDEEKCKKKVKGRCTGTLLIVIVSGDKKCRVCGEVGTVLIVVRSVLVGTAHFEFRSVLVGTAEAWPTVGFVTCFVAEVGVAEW